MTQTVGANIGERISRYRRMNGLTAQELADLAGEGLSRSILANLESGRRNDLPVRQLVAISVALQVPIGALLLDIERPLEATNLEIGASEIATVTPEGSVVARSVSPTLTVLEALQWFGGEERRTFGSNDWPKARKSIEAHLLLGTMMAGMQDDVATLRMKMADAELSGEDAKHLFQQLTEREQTLFALMTRAADPDFADKMFQRPDGDG